MNEQSPTIDRATMRTVLLCGALLLCACSEQPEEAELPDSDAVGDVEIEEEPIADDGFRHRDWSPSPDPTSASFRGIAFRKPALWIETPPVTSLREANYTVPGRRGQQAAELAVLWFAEEFALPLDVHINRLRSQFEPDDSGDRPEPTVDELEADGLTVTTIDLSGAYVKPGSAWYTPGQRVVTAIVEEDDGQLLLRLTGPQATVEANLDAFRTMLESARRVGDGSPGDGHDQPDFADNG